MIEFIKKLLGIDNLEYKIRLLEILIDLRFEF